MRIFKMLQEDTYRIKPNNMHQANRMNSFQRLFRESVAKDQ
jgi:hypothetical protein